jgi:hypothetical protein
VANAPVERRGLRVTAVAEPRDRPVNCENPPSRARRDPPGAHNQVGLGCWQAGGGTNFDWCAHTTCAPTTPASHVTVNPSGVVLLLVSMITRPTNGRPATGLVWLGSNLTGLAWETIADAPEMYTVAATAANPATMMTPSLKRRGKLSPRRAPRARGASRRGGRSGERSLMPVSGKKRLAENRGRYRG